MYRALQDSVSGDAYIVFGALGAASFLAIGIALLPSMNRAGWGGRVFAWAVIAGAAVTILSYFGSPVGSPLHKFWGAEAYALIAIGTAGVLAAITAGRRWPAWARALLASTLVVLVLGALALAYYPHGCLATLGLASAALILASPRAEVPTSRWPAV